MSPEMDLASVLRSLRNEARALVGVDRPELVSLVGVTNVACLERRLEQADRALEAMELERRRGTIGAQSNPEPSDASATSGDRT